MPDQKTYPGFILLLAASVFLVVGVISATLMREGSYSKKDVRKFEKTLHNKERLLKEEFLGLNELLNNDNPTGILDKKSIEYQELATREGIFIFYYDEGLIKYWSDHTVPVADRWRPRMNRPFISLRNAYYTTVIQPFDKGMLVGMIEIKTRYPSQNEFLVNGFQEDFDLDPKVEIEFIEAEGSEAVYNDAGEYLFSLDFSKAEPRSSGLRVLAISCLLFSLLMFFIGCCSLLRRSTGTGRYLWLGVITVLIAGSVVAIFKYSFPALLTDTKLFQPEIFASRFFPSLGALLVFSISALLLGGLYYLFGNLEKLESERWKRGTATLLFVAAALLFLVIEQLTRILVLDSSISFEAQRVTTFTGNTLVGLSVIIIWFVLLGLVLDRAIYLLRGSIWRPLLYGSVAISLTFLAALLFPGMQSSLPGWIVILGILAGQHYIRYKQLGRIPFSRFVFLVFIISVFMTIRLQESNSINVERQTGGGAGQTLFGA